MENNSEHPQPQPAPLKPQMTKKYIKLVLPAIALIIILAVVFSYWKITRRMHGLEQLVTSLSHENTRLKTADIAPVAPIPSAPIAAPHPVEPIQEPQKDLTAAKDNYRLSVIVAVADVREELQMGKPFVQKMSIVTALLKNDPVALPYIETLQPFAERGVPNHETLKKDFDDAQEKIALLGQGLPANPSFTDRLAYSFSKVIRIRKVNPEKTGSKDSITLMHEAQAALAAGNVAQALQLTNSLQEAEAKAIVASWAEEATIFLKAQDAIYNLYSHIASPAYGSQATAKETTE